MSRALSAHRGRRPTRRKKWVALHSYLTGHVCDNTVLNEVTRRLSVALDRPATAARPGDYYFLRFEAAGIGHEWHRDLTRKVGRVAPGTPVRVPSPSGCRLGPRGSRFIAPDGSREPAQEGG